MWPGIGGNLWPDSGPSIGISGILQSDSGASSGIGEILLLDPGLGVRVKSGSGCFSFDPDFWGHVRVRVFLLCPGLRVKSGSGWFLVFCLFGFF